MRRRAMHQITHLPLSDDDKHDRVSQVARAMKEAVSKYEGQPMTSALRVSIRKDAVRALFFELRSGEKIPIRVAEEMVDRCLDQVFGQEVKA